MTSGYPALQPTIPGAKDASDEGLGQRSRRGVGRYRQEGVIAVAGVHSRASCRDASHWPGQGLLPDQDR
jgi:hypothetical protein